MSQVNYIFEKEINTEGCHIRVFKPDLTKEERMKRMKVLVKATEALLKASIDAGRNTHEKAQ